MTVFCCPSAPRSPYMSGRFRDTLLHFQGQSQLQMWLICQTS